MIAKVWSNYRPEWSDSSGTGRKGAIISEVREENQQDQMPY